MFFLLSCRNLHNVSRFSLTGRKTFYIYCALMASLDAAQTIGSGLIYFGTIYGMW